MSEEEDSSFRDLGLFGKIVVIVLMALLIIGSLAFAVGVTFFGFAGFFRIFDVTYDSLGSLGLFIVFYFLLGLAAEIFAKGLKMLVIANLSSKVQLAMTQIIIDTLFEWLIIFTVDEFLRSVTVRFRLNWRQPFYWPSLNTSLMTKIKRERHHEL
ncbi:YrvL family regulatory protein [Lentibacillus juripiscarius]|uniref:YrvL family regulatory protein n=1 Tax=Lentibacillus juripiscarius TaxID=257446 RepID=A0ABW5V7A8_9BACI